MTTKEHAAELLHRYDAMRKEIRALERDLHKAVTAYGKATGRWGFNKDHFRIELDNEERARIEARAPQALWEQTNA
jgi:type II secretory pathway component PulJ